MEKLCATLVSQYVKILPESRTERELINLAGSSAGICYRAEDSESANKRRLLDCIRKGHTSVLEHAVISFEVRCDRGTSHAIVRHRHCAFTQESTIYTKYTRFSELQFIELPTYDKYNKNKRRDKTDQSEYRGKCQRHRRKCHNSFKKNSSSHHPYDFFSEFHPVTSLTI